MTNLRQSKRIVTINPAQSHIENYDVTGLAVDFFPIFHVCSLNERKKIASLIATIRLSHKKVCFFLYYSTSFIVTVICIMFCAISLHPLLVSRCYFLPKRRFFHRIFVAN